MRLRSVLVAGVLVAVSLSTAACGETTQTAEQAREQAPGFVTSGDCPEERSVVRRALDRSRLRVDMDGDGQLDEVAVASRPEAQEPCRGFVGVRLEGGSTYSTHLFARAVPLEGLPARIVGLIRLENQPGAQIVVDTRAAVDALLAQMFTLADGRLRAVEVPGFADGTFIVEGGGVIYPHGAACTADGQMVVTEAAQTRDGRRFEVTRRTYDIPGVPLRLSDPAVERETVPVAELVARFPELDDPHWRACAAPVSRS